MNNKKNQTDNIKNQIGKDVIIKLAMELPKKPEKPIVPNNNNSNNK